MWGPNLSKLFTERLTMNHKRINVTLVIMLCFIPSLFAGTRDIVLQNGLNEYNGCEETSLSSSDPAGMYGEFTNCMLTYEKCTS